MSNLGVNSFNSPMVKLPMIYFNKTIFHYRGHGKRIEATLEMRLGLATKTRDPTMITPKGTITYSTFRKGKSLTHKCVEKGLICWFPGWGVMLLFDVFAT